MAKFALNNTWQASLKASPFYVTYGFHPRLLPLPIAESQVPAALELAHQVHQVHQDARKNLEEAKRQYKQAADRRRVQCPEIQPGDQVWLSAWDLRLPGPSRKFTARFLGPFQVLNHVGKVSYCLCLSSSWREHPVFHRSLLKPHVPNVFPGRTKQPPSPMSVQGELEYEVEDICASKYSQGRLYYLVHWKG